MNRHAGRTVGQGRAEGQGDRGQEGSKLVGMAQHALGAWLAHFQ